MKSEIEYTNRVQKMMTMMTIFQDKTQWIYKLFVD
ncbi:hypothetical protein pb186bvf_007928 [Paramecium bursaria]